MHNIPLWTRSDFDAPPDPEPGDLESLAGHRFDIDVETRPGEPVVAHVFGSIDLLTAPELRMCLDDHLDDHHGAAGFVLDFSHVDFLAATGLAVLTETDATARRDDHAWALVANTRPVLRPLEVLGLVDALPTYDSLPAAVAAVRAATVTG